MNSWRDIIRKEFDEEEDFLPKDIDDVEPSEDMDYLTMTDKTLKNRWYGILEQLSTTSDFRPMVHGGGKATRRKGRGLIMAAKTFAADMMDGLADIRTKKVSDTNLSEEEKLDEEKGFNQKEVDKIVNMSLGSPLNSVVDTLNEKVRKIQPEGEKDLVQELNLDFTNYDSNRENVDTGILSDLDATGMPDEIKREVAEKVKDVVFEFGSPTLYAEAGESIKKVIESKGGQNYIGHLLVSAMKKLMRERDVMSPEDLDETIPDTEPDNRIDVTDDFNQDDDEDTWQGSIGDKLKGPKDDWFGLLKKDVDEAIDDLEEVSEKYDLSEHDWSSVDDASDYLFEHKVNDDEEN